MKAVDLFSGIGGFRKALEISIPEAEIVFSCEIDDKAREVYMKNFGDDPKGDITKIDAKYIPDHDLLMGGFPCQVFSLAGVPKLRSLGRGTGFKNLEKGNLFFEIARILEAKKPKAFLLENVKNLESHDGGKTFEIIKRTLMALGYTIYWKVLDARHFGLPQKRLRVFIVGFREKLHFSFPVGDPKLRPKTIDILEENVPDKYTLMDSTWEWLKKHREKHEKLGHGFGYQMVDVNKSAFTVVAHYRKDPHTNLIPQDGKNPRKFTPREYARLQGFPDDFFIHPTEGHAYRQIGNSIPIPVVIEILKKIKISLETRKKKIDIDSFLTYKPRRI